MKIKFIQTALDRIRGKKHLEIPAPYYNSRIYLPSEYPAVYNGDGKKMDVFFLRDRHFSHSPYGTFPTYFLWDRFNYGLKTHFYTGKSIKETVGTPDVKYGWLLEPRSKQLTDYTSIEKNKELAKEFKAILTYDERLLDSLDNALFFPGCASSWVEKTDPDIWQKKTKNVSILSSHKKNCPLHFLRLDIAWKCKKEGWADTFGTFDGGAPVKMKETLEDYRYSIALENQVSDYFFTERLISAFITMTVPIYLGARKIDRLFNPDGIIQINEKQAENIEDVLKQCSETDYTNRLHAIRENYEKALAYMNLHDMLYEALFLSQSERKLTFDFSGIGKK